MVREFLEDMSSEVDRLTRIVERLLDLTKSDSQKAAAQLETVDLTKLITKIVKKLLPLAREKKIKLTFSYEAKRATQKCCSTRIRFTKQYTILWITVSNIQTRADMSQSQPYLRHCKICH